MSFESRSEDTEHTVQAYLIIIGNPLIFSQQNFNETLSESQVPADNYRQNI